MQSSFYQKRIKDLIVITQPFFNRFRSFFDMLYKTRGANTLGTYESNQVKRNSEMNV